MARYKVGDRVTIKSKEWYDENKDGIGEVNGDGAVFVPLMSKYCGKSTTIAEVLSSKGTYRLDIDGGRYNWSEYALHDSNFIGKYKVGDAVQIKPLEWYNENKSNSGFIGGGEHARLFVPAMSQYCGRTALITHYVPGERGCYKLSNLDGNIFVWCDYMFTEKVQEEPVEVEEVEEEQPITDVPTIKTGISIIIDERLRQLTTKGYDNAHDDKHNKGELAHAAALFAYPEISSYVLSEKNWPEGKAFYHPTEEVSTVADRIKELAKAGALITAEIDRLNRLDPSSEYTEPSARKGFSD